MAAEVAADAEAVDCLEDDGEEPDDRVDGR